jgi:transcriptional regulator with XRE-family HTH domain
VEYLPFAELVSGARRRQGLSLNGVARGIHAAARQEGTHCGTTRQAILGYERGRIPHADLRRWLAVALDLPLEEVAAAAEAQARYRMELRLLGSIEGMAPGRPESGTLKEDVQRRDLLSLFGRAATAGLLGSALGRLPVLSSTTPVDAGSIEAVTSVSRSYRQLWSTVPAEDLRDMVLGHARLISRLFTSATSETDQAGLAAAGSETSVLAAWLAEDLCDFGAVQRHYGQARTYAERSQDNLLQVYVVSGWSSWAARAGSGAEAVRLAGQAADLLPRNAPPAARTSVAAREATAHAAAHDEPATSNALIRAEKALGEADGVGEAPWPWMVPVNGKEVTRYRGVAAVSLKLPGMAVPALTEALDSSRPFPTKERAYGLSKLAEAHVLAGDVEQACDLGAQAFGIASQLRDTWSLVAVRNVRVQLAPMETTRAVRAFDERMLSTLLTLPR